jgi:hypothetical protein
MLTLVYKLTWVLIKLISFFSYFSGNYLSRYYVPYDEGEPCASCPDHCDDGLCSKFEVFKLTEVKKLMSLAFTNKDVF